MAGRPRRWSESIAIAGSRCCSHRLRSTTELERWLAETTTQSVRHLVQGIRARWFTRDVEAAFGAVMTRVGRFKADEVLQWASRIELLRAAARVVRTR